MLNPLWPVLKHYDQAHLARIALPLGGIGTGTVSLGGRGDLRDWEIVNRPAKGFTPTAGGVGGVGGPFFALRAASPDGAAVVRCLEGPLDLADYEGPSGARLPNHGLPRFRECTFAAAYPFGQLLLRDPAMPLEARIEAFNPFIPADADRSGLPIAVLRFVLTNPTGQPVAASLVGSLPNFIGADGSAAGSKDAPGPKGNRNVFRTGEGLCGLFLISDGLPPSAEQWGSIALTALTEEDVTYRTDWLKPHWGTSLLDFWDDFAADGRLDRRPASGSAMPIASLAVSLTVPPHATQQVTFVLAWYFPNRMTWTPKQGDPAESCACQGACGDPNLIGNYYATQFRDAWDVVERVAPSLPALEAETVAFVSAFCESDLPAVVKEAALFNLCILRSQTCFRTPDGRFYGWEGCNDGQGCCHGSCTHVWNYEQATPFLFGDLARRMREVEFGHATDDAGRMSFRVNLPLARGQEFGMAAADGQMGCLMKLYRDWQLAGDDAMLRALWPKARKALEFCWIPGGWDADRDGVMEGCQHNTMDVEYYGPNPQMEGWYLGALRAAEEMARYLGQADFAATCRDLFERGRAWTDAHLFNGEYYEHEIRPPAVIASGVGEAIPVVAPGLRVGMGATDLSRPDYQLGAGCLVDQLVGQFMAHVCDLGYLHDPDHVAATLASIVKYNRRQGFHGHFNCMRSYVLGDETALLMASYPKARPDNPFPYFTEVMTGFEHTAAVGMLYEGQIAEGLRCIEDVRSRYDGRKRSPFDEAECGHHYARAMASWAAVLALTGFGYSGVTASMTFAAKEGVFFWSNGDAWGSCRLARRGEDFDVALTLLHSELSLARFALRGFGEQRWPGRRRVARGETIRFAIAPSG